MRSRVCRAHRLAHLGRYFPPSLMKKLFSFFVFTALFLSCTQPGTGTNEPEQPKDPEGTIYYVEDSVTIFANPERGFHSQTYYKSSDLNNVANAANYQRSREGDYKMTLYLHSYYLTDYMESDIPQAFLDRLDRNMQALREGGAKCVVRFSYKDNYRNQDKPWDAEPEWMHRHIDQVAPYLMKNADVIFCIQCGWIGSWGEWYYTTAFPFNPSADVKFEGRWELVEHYMDVTPKDRQIAFRTPGYKMRYLRMRGLDQNPLTPEEAFQPTIKARWAGHNDCFVASANDVGTYFSADERRFWEADTKYSVMGGETCGECQFSTGENAVKQMALTHWTYINKDYHGGVINSWIKDKHMDEIKRRLGYRLVLDKAYFTQDPVAGQAFTAQITLHNVGFAAPVNKRDVELIFVNKADPSKKFVYPMNDVEPRLWLPEDGQILVNLNFGLKADMPEGEYNLYLNLPDPYASLHDNPAFSIRLANENVWEAETGYNRLATITVSK